MVSNDIVDSIHEQLNQHKYEDANRKIADLLAEHPSDLQLLELKIDCQWNLGRNAEAVQGCIDLARRAADQDNLTAAIGFLRKASRINPDNPALETLVEEFSNKSLGITLTPNILRNCTLFDVLDGKSFMFLAKKARWRLFMPGQPIIVEGDKEDQRLFILLKGVAEVRFRDENEDMILARLNPGYLFGEVSFLTYRPRSASVQAKSRVEVLEIPGDTMRDLIEREPRVQELLNNLHQIHFAATLEIVKKKRLNEAHRKA